jgi:hypothetical protein
MSEPIYWKPDRLLSYDRVMNMVIGGRSIGKTYGIKKQIIKEFIEKGHQFIYLRRYKGELKKVGQFFDAVSQEFPNHEFKVKGREFWIDGKKAGYAVPLSAWQSEKGVDYPNVRTIFFDEFLREKDNSRYLDNEVNALFNIGRTVFRNRNNVRYLMASNATSIVNPYFLTLDIVPDLNKRFNAYKDVVVEIPDSKEFTATQAETKFASLIKNTDYGQMDLNNKFMNDSYTFVEKRSKHAKFLCSIVFEGFTFGIWCDPVAGLYYMSQAHDPNTKKVFALTDEDHNINRFLLDNYKNHFELFKTVQAFKHSYLRFDSILVRKIGYEMFKKLNVF